MLWKRVGVLMDFGSWWMLKPELNLPRAAPPAAMLCAPRSLASSRPRLLPSLELVPLNVPVSPH